MREHDTMKLTIKILLLITLALASFPRQIISGSYTYREPVAIVDETIKKTNDYYLKRKLVRLEEALEIEVERQLSLRFREAENFSRRLAQQPPASEDLASVTHPSQSPAKG